MPTLSSPLVFGEFSSGGTAPFSTTPQAVDLGTAAVLHGLAITSWTANNRGTPAGFNVGTDTLTAIGSTFIGPNGGRWQAYRGPLSVRNTQNLIADFTAITDLDSGHPGWMFWTISDTGAITFSGDTIVSGSALAEFITGSGGGTLSKTIASAVGELAVLAGFDRYSIPGVVLSAVSGTTVVPGSLAMSLIATKPGAAPNVTPGVTFSGPNAFSQLVNWGFSVASSVATSVSGTATLDDITASGSITSAPPSTLSGAATLDDVAASGGITSAPVVGTFTSESLRWNNDTVEASVALTWLSFRNITTGAVVLNKTGVSTNSLGVFSVADALLVPGTALRVDWKTADGHHGWGIATPV